MRVPEPRRHCVVGLLFWRRVGWEDPMGPASWASSWHTLIVFLCTRSTLGLMLFGFLLEF